MRDAALIHHPGQDATSHWVCTFPDDETGAWGIHRHAQHQVAWVSTGSCTVVAPGGPWVATPSRAVWIPRDCPHDIHVTPGARLVCFYVWPDHCPLDWSVPCEVEVGPLAREVLLHLAPTTADTVAPIAYATVLFDQLARHAPLDRPTLPMPSDPRAADVARAILDDPSSPNTLEDWAHVVATSTSTLRRAFLSGTSLTFSEWRARARLDAALPLLARGDRTELVALQVGYASRSGFVAAYHRHFGQSLPADR